jgi:O-antigen/teichoic acid export membrane protein
VNEPRHWSLALLRAGSGTVASQALSLALLPLLFRAYQPADFGAWAVTTAVVLAIGSIATLRYELAFVVERDAARASVLFWICLLGGLGVALLLGAAAALLIRVQWGAATLELPRLAMCAVWVCSVVIAQVMQSWLLREGRFGSNSAVLVATTLGAGVAQLGVAPWVGGASGLVLGSTLASLLGAFVAALRVHPVAPAKAGLDWSLAQPLLRAHRRFPLYSAPFSLVTIARERISAVLLSGLLPLAQVGAYSQAWRLVQVPVGLTSSALRPVMFHAAAESGIASVGPMLRRMIRLVCIAGAPWVGLLCVDPRLLFATVLGAAWTEAGPLAAALSIAALAFAVSNWMDRLLDVLGRQDLNLWTEVFTLLASTLGLMLPLAFGASLLWACGIQSVVLALCYLTVVAIVVRIGGFGLRALLWPVLLAVAIGVVSWALGSALHQRGQLDTGALVAVLLAALASGGGAWHALKTS